MSPAYCLKLKNIILLLNQGLLFFSNDHIRNVISTFPNVVKIDVENDNVVSTLPNVVPFNVDVHNVVSTLIWRCAMSRSHINLKTTLDWSWNVCWVEGDIFVSAICQHKTVSKWTNHVGSFGATDVTKYPKLSKSNKLFVTGAQSWSKFFSFSQFLLIANNFRIVVNVEDVAVCFLVTINFGEVFRKRNINQEKKFVKVKERTKVAPKYQKCIQTGVSLIIS